MGFSKTGVAKFVAIKHFCAAKMFGGVPGKILRRRESMSAAPYLVVATERYRNALIAQCPSKSKFRRLLAASKKDA